MLKLGTKDGLYVEAFPQPVTHGYRRGLARDLAVEVNDGPVMGLQAHVLVKFRPFQRAVFDDRTSGVLVLHWARQIGKSFVLAAWAVDRLLTRPGRLVTVLSNSRENGAEFLRKCAEICELNGTEFRAVDASAGITFQNMRLEIRIRVAGKTGRIKVLAANARTARGFSGDLILDEFAFHEEGTAIWEAAEPILAGHADFLCRVASTGNGKRNLFYRMATGAEIRSPKSEIRMSEMEARPHGSTELAEVPGPVASQARHESISRDETCSSDECEGPSQRNVRPHPGPLPREREKQSCGLDNSDVNCVDGRFERLTKSEAGFAVSRVRRSEAWRMGVGIYDAHSRLPVSPEEARAAALDKAAYDQNYECAFADENMTLLSHALISAAEREGVGIICEQDWSAAALDLLRAANGSLYAGFDVGRKVDLSVLTVFEAVGELRMVRAILRMQGMRLPEQQLRLGEVCRMPQFRRAAIDMTGLGLGLFEYAQRDFGVGRIQGINFASSVPATRAILLEGRRQERVRVTEALAVELLRAYEDRRIQHPADGRLRDDLRKPEKITTPGGRVSIAATRDEAGHADHFWSFALGLEAAGSAPAPGAVTVIRRKRGMLV